jgi:hypothetical protein
MVVIDNLQIKCYLQKNSVNINILHLIAIDYNYLCYNKVLYFNKN